MSAQVTNKLHHEPVVKWLIMDEKANNVLFYKQHTSYS
jgi:hypothetical protein